MKFSVPLTRSTSPSSPKTVLSPLPSRLVTRSTLVEISCSLSRSSSPSPSLPQELLSPSAPVVVLPVAVVDSVLPVVAVDSVPVVVLPVAVVASVVVVVVVVSVVVAVVVSAVAVASLVEVVAVPPVVVVASAVAAIDRSKCTVSLWRFGGSGSFFRNIFPSSCASCAIATSLAAGCRISPVKNVSVIFIGFSRTCNCILNHSNSFRNSGIIGSNIWLGCG